MVIVGDGVAVTVARSGGVKRPGEGEGDPSTDTPQPERNAANAAAPAPRRRLRRSMGYSCSDMQSILPANHTPVNSACVVNRSYC